MGLHTCRAGVVNDCEANMGAGNWFGGWEVRQWRGQLAELWQLLSKPTYCLEGCRVG